MINIFFKKINYKNKAGFSVIEVLIACLIMSMITIALMSAASRGIGLSINALKKVQASNLMEEGVEAVKSIRDNNWDTILSYDFDANYYLSFDINSNNWQLGKTIVEPVDGVFTRTIVFSRVYRDSNDDIAATGNLDNGIKRVTVNVSWLDSGQTTSREITFYLANIFN